MGDDSIETFVENAPAKYRELGHTIKGNSYDVIEDDRYEFCSHIFDGTHLAYPVNPDKLLFRFLAHRPSTELLPQLIAQFSLNMRNHGERDEYETYAAQIYDRVEQAGRASSRWADLENESRKSPPGAESP
jgi:hypothetical protein